MLVLALVVGALLRFSGLAHDLEQAYVYHPDTPKQMVAVQSFLEGEYAFHTGNLNYDAYPYFNSRLVQGLYTLVAGTAAWTTELLGLPVAAPQPDRMLLLWLTRLLNATLAVATILLAYALACLVAGRRAGVLTAWLVALGPIEVVTCHYAMSESTAAFFAVSAVGLALLAVARDRPAWLIAASAALVAGFAAKYHAAVVVTSLAVAFGILLWRRRRTPLPMVGLAAGCLLVGWATLAVAHPPFARAPLAFVGRVANFMAYTSNFQLPEAIASRPLPLRLLFGMTHNLPHFAYTLTWLGFLLAGVGCLLGGRWRSWVWTLAAAPIGYIVIGLASKPFAHAEYHTIVTPVLAVLCAVAVVGLHARAPGSRVVRGVLAGLVMACILVPLAQRSVEQVAYFRMHDTRRLAHDWVQRNLPATIQVAAGHYAYPVVPPSVEPDRLTGVVMLSASFRPHPSPASHVLHNAFALGDHAMEIFRNPDIDLYLHGCDGLDDGTVLDFAPCFPAAQWSLAAPILDAVRDVRIDQHRVIIEPTRPARTRLVTATPVSAIMLTVTAGPATTRLKGRVGQRKVNLTLAPHERRTIRLARPRRVPWLRSKAVCFYDVSLRMPYGIAALDLASADEGVDPLTATAAPQFLATLPPYEVPLVVNPVWGGVPIFLPAGHYGVACAGLPTETLAPVELVDSQSGACLVELTDGVMRPLIVPAESGMLMVRPTVGPVFASGARLQLFRVAPATSTGVE
jgi:hypothetical protein